MPGNDRTISQTINTERVQVRVTDPRGVGGFREISVYRAWVGERPAVSGYGALQNIAIADLLSHLRNNEVSYTPAEPVPSIRVYDGTDHRFYGEEFFRLAPVSGVVQGSGVSVTTDDGTYIGFVSGREILNLARRGQTGATG